MSGAKCNAPKSAERNDREGDHATMLLPRNAEKTSPERRGGRRSGGGQAAPQRAEPVSAERKVLQCVRRRGVDDSVKITASPWLQKGSRVAREAHVGLSTKLRIQTEFTNTTEAVEGISGPR
jgi:hypothetical protein